eukprot:SAG31_NODE_25550_length_459_cov_0.966667_1_plen_113_part_01
MQVPSTLSYATGPYGPDVYLWASQLSMAVDPLMALLALRYRAAGKTLLLLVGVWSALGLYTLVLALQSPAPPLRGTGIGTFLVVVASVGRAALLSCTFAKRFHILAHLRTALS